MDKYQNLKIGAEVEALVNEMHLNNEASSHELSRSAPTEGLKVETNGALVSSEKARNNASTPPSIKSEKTSQSPQMMKDGSREVVGRETAVKLEPAHPPKLVRMASHKASLRPVTLFDTYADKTEESKGTFQVIEACIYSSKQIGSTEQAMECDCAEEWSKITITYAHWVDEHGTDSKSRYFSRGQHGLWRRFGLH